MGEPQHEGEPPRSCTPGDRDPAAAESDPAAAGDEPPSSEQVTEPGPVPPKGWFLA